MTASYASLLLQLAVPLIAYDLWHFRAGPRALFENLGLPRRILLVSGLLWGAAAYVVFHRSLLQLESPFVYFQF